MIRSKSGDIDIVAQFVSNINSITGDIYIENGTGNAKNIFEISDCSLSEEQLRAVMGLHAFSGNDYIACFFRKGKKTCWRTASKGFMELFSCLGETYNLDPNQKDEIEKFVCALYGKPKLKKVNKPRAAIFWGKYNQSKKIADLSMLPPCQGNLMLHLKHENYVAYNMRHSCELRPIKEN